MWMGGRNGEVIGGDFEVGMIVEGDLSISLVYSCVHGEACLFLLCRIGN